MSKIIYKVNGQTVDGPPPLPEGREGAFLDELRNHEVARCMTDDIRSADAPTVADKIAVDPHGFGDICRTAESFGMTVTPFMHYHPELAAFPGDPAAFSGHDMRGHQRRVKESRNETLLDEDGTVITKRREPESDPFEKPVYKLHPRIVERRVKQMVRDNPDLAHADQVDLRESIVDKHGA